MHDLREPTPILPSRSQAWKVVVICINRGGDCKFREPGMIVNCDGLHWPKRKDAFHTTVNELKPYIIFGCESKLNSNIPTYFVFLEAYRGVSCTQDR